MPPAPSRYDIVKSYRDLYKSALHAVQFSSPSRYTLKSQIRLAYRSNDTESFNPTKIENTLLFLRARSLSIAHSEARSQLIESSFRHFTITLKLLNESMDMCLPERELDKDAIEELDHWKQLQFFGGNRRPATQHVQRAEPSEGDAT
ncbi:MAG: hypothetical protein LQ345_002104 [Seirophora villosa]|nr:MAG: hypothetical protein LQ345_002104 [Seirophora villosa]